jgi:glycosyltransferase involved in cell wall biosynthesis
MKKLAICIPTYNRSKLLDRLLKSIPSINDIMVSICDDGSTDNTSEIVKKHKSRISIKYFYQQNKGRATALRKSILNSKANFIMIADSDDYFEKNGIKRILRFIKKNKSTNFFVFPIKIKKNLKSSTVSLNGIPKTSYISLRSDYKIKTDLQEVINNKLLLDVMYSNPTHIKRIPTSYLWFKVSEKENCLPINCFPVKVKEYLSDGMSANLLPFKVKYPKYMVYIYKIALKSNKYKSLLYRIKYTILFYRYSYHNNTLQLLKFKDCLFFLIGYLFGLFDLLRLVVNNKR